MQLGQSCLCSGVKDTESIKSLPGLRSSYLTLIESRVEDLQGRHSSVASSLSDPQTPPQATPSLSRRSSTMLPPHQVPLCRQQSLPPLPKEAVPHTHTQQTAAVRSDCCENPEQGCHCCKHRLPEELHHEAGLGFKEPYKPVPSHTVSC